MADLKYSTPKEAESAFYAAFESGDVEAMMAVWADDDGIECIHPMGARHQGRAAVRESWRRVFEGSGAMACRLSEPMYRMVGSLSVHTVHENITVAAMAEQGESVVVATNVYRLTAEGWRMVLHHGSVAPGTTSRRHGEPAPPAALH